MWLKSDLGTATTKANAQGHEYLKQSIPMLRAMPWNKTNGKDRLIPIAFRNAMPAIWDYHHPHPSLSILTFPMQVLVL